MSIGIVALVWNRDHASLPPANSPCRELSVPEPLGNVREQVQAGGHLTRRQVQAGTVRWGATQMLRRSAVHKLSCAVTWIADQTASGSSAESIAVSQAKSRMRTPCSDRWNRRDL